MKFNSNVIRPQDILRGSGMIEVASYGSSDWYNIGAVSGLSVSENFETYMAEGDTVYESNYVTNQNMILKFVQHEVLNSDIYEILRGVDTISEQITDETQQVKITSGDLTDLNEIKARITTKIDNDNFYFYFHRGYVRKGKAFDYKKDNSEDDNRIKQEWEIIFLPDSANSDQIYYTLQPSYYSEIFYHCQGGIFTGVTLDVDGTGTLPIDDWTWYDEETYDDSTYSPAAYYESRMRHNETGHTITWTATGDAGDVKFSYRVGNDKDSLSAWSSPVDAVGSGSETYGYEYFQYRFIFYSDAWSDTDSVVVNSIT